MRSGDVAPIRRDDSFATQAGAKESYHSMSGTPPITTRGKALLAIGRRCL
jgi:hypothetical protein